ncbi:MAG: nucleotide pyrophosphatase, partial [Myxococcota bacterium]
DTSAMGQVEDAIITENHDKWSGDHCIDPDEVPGVLFSTLSLQKGRAHLTDMAPTILEYFGTQVPAGLAGRSLLDKANKEDA